jgi:hypothetical protein
MTHSFPSVTTSPLVERVPYFSPGAKVVRRVIRDDELCDAGVGKSGAA